MRFLLKAAGETVKMEGPAGHFTGYGSTFGNVDSDGDIIMPGAFARSLADAKSKGMMPKMLFQHDRARPIGDYLDLREDDHGLWLEGQLWIDGQHPNQDALTAHRMMKSAGGSGLSIGFYVRGDEFDRETGIRKITDAKLVEVSVVTFPANELAMTTAVKAAEWITSPRDFEEFLRDAGFSRNAAKAITAGGWKNKADARDEPAGDKGDPRDAAAEALDDLLRTLRQTRAA
jgi:HK97 family phage prohead protease